MIPSEKSKAILENEAKETIAKLRAGSNQPTSDELMEEIERRWKEWISKDQDHVEGILAKSEFAYFALHFARWQREQMLKKAVEGYVDKDYIVTEGPSYFIRSINLDLPNGLKEGGEVKLIFVKED